MRHESLIAPSGASGQRTQRTKDGLLQRKVSAWRRAWSELGSLGGRLISGDPEALFAVILPALWLYTWLAVGPHLIAHGAGTISNFPVLWTGTRFLWETVAKPGGAVEYASAFLAQLFFDSRAGAAVIVGLGWTLWRATDAAVQVIRVPSLRFLRFVGPMAMAITYAQYRFELQTYLAFATSAGCAVLVCRRPWHQTLPCFLVASPLVYALAGGGHVVYAVICALHEVHVRRRRWGAVLALSTIALTPFTVGMVVFDYGPWDAYTLLLPFSPGRLVHLLVPTTPDHQSDGFPGVSSAIELLTAAVFYLACLLPMLFKTIRLLVWSSPAPIVRPAVTRKTPSRPGLRRFLRTAMVVVALILVTNRERRDLIETDFLAYQGRWSELLGRAHGYARSALVLHSVNRALFHTGQLGDHMFEFQQTGADVLLLGRDYRTPFDWENMIVTAPRLWRRAMLFKELGLLHAAKTDLLELTENLGFRPMVVRELALVSLAVRDIGTARVALGMLSRSMFHADWAAEKLAILDREERLVADPEIQRLRSRLCSTKATSSRPAVDDITETFINDKEVLQRLVADAPGNKMAYEYFLAWCLLDRQLDAFAQGLALRPDPHSRALAVHHKEALALYGARDAKSAGAALAFAPDPTVAGRLRAYRSQHRDGHRARGGPTGAATGFDTTYWSYYDAASPSGVGR